MTETKITYKVNEEGLLKILVNAFNETKNTDWILELLLCYDDNQKLLEDLGLSIDDVRTFSSIKRSKAKITVDSIRLHRLSDCEVSKRTKIKQEKRDRILAILNKNTEILQEIENEL